MVKSVTIDRLPVTGNVNDSDLLIVRSVADGVTRQITKLQLFGELTEDVGDVLENYGTRSIVPALDGAYDLGSVDKTWRDLYIDGTLYAGNIVGQLDSNVTFDSSYFRNVLDSDFILSLTAGAFSGIISRIDFDSDRLDAQISRITDLSLSLSALDSDYAAYKIATADAFDELYVRIYLDSDRLSTVAGDLTLLQTNVSNLDLLGFDSDGVAAMIDSATSIVRSELISRIDITDSNVLILAGDISDLQVQASLLDSAIKVNGSAISELTTRIELDSDRLSVISTDVVDLRADLNNVGGVDSSAILGIVDSAVAAARSELIARIDVTDSTVSVLAADISTLNAELILLDSAIAVNGSAISNLSTRIDLDSDRLSAVSSDVVSLNASLTALQLNGIDSDFIIGLVDSATSSAVSQLTARIDADSDSLTLLASDVTTLRNDLTLLEDSVAASSVAVSNLTSRIDLDSDRLSSLSTSLVSLSNTVSNLQLSGIDSDLVGALIDSAVSNAVTTLTSRIDADSDSLVLVASRVTDLENEVRFDSSSVATTTAYQDLVSRIDVDSNSLQLLSQDVTTLSNSISGFQDSIDANSTAIAGLTSIVNATSDSVSVLSQDVTDLSSTVSGFQGSIDANSTAISNLTSRVDADSNNLVSLSQDVTTLSNSISGLSGYDSDLFVASIAYSGLTSSITANDSGISAAISDISQLSLDVSGLSDDVSATAELAGGFDARITATEDDITSIQAKWFVDIDVNGHVAGLELLNDGTTSNFSVVADNFKVINASDAEIQPFTVNGDVVEMSNVVAKNINVVDTTSEGRTTITGDGIKIESSTDGQNYVTRVKLGNLGNL